MSTREELDALRDAMRALLEREHPPSRLRQRHEQGGGLDRPLWQWMRELGWLGMALDEADGGLGLGWNELRVLHEELGRSLAAVPALGSLLASQALQWAGSAAQRTRWLSDLASGEVTAAVALPVDARSTWLTLDGQGHADGVVSHVLFADGVDLLVLPVADAAGTRSLLLVPAKADGVAIERQPLVDLSRDLCTVRLTRVPAEPQALLRLDEAHWQRLTDTAALALACEAIGAAQRILEITVTYLGERRQFDRPIGSFQALQHRAADWKVRLEAATALVTHAAAQMTAGSADSAALASSAKFYACDSHVAIAGDAVQLHGGIGFTWEHDCHLFLKRALLDQQLFGSSTGHQDRAARLLFGTAESTLEAS